MSLIITALYLQMLDSASANDLIKISVSICYYLSLNHTKLTDIRHFAKYLFWHYLTGSASFLLNFCTIFVPLTFISANFLVAKRHRSAM